MADGAELPMSELHIGLLGIGLLVVIAVVLYNKIQESRLRRAAERAFASTHEDVLLAPGQTSGNPVEDQALRRIEPTLGPAPEESAELLDQGIDFIGELEAPQAVSGQIISAAIVDGLGPVAGPVVWEGHNAQAGKWEMLAASGDYRRLRAGLQMANRNGAVTAADIDAFCVRIEVVGQAIGASCRFGDKTAALQRARALDAFCADIDVQIGLNLLARSGTIAGTRVRALAEAYGLSLESDGKFHRRDDSGLELFTLCNMGEPAFSAPIMKDISASGLTLLFDVARAPGGIDTFDKFVEFTRSLADALSAAIVDDNRQPLDTNGLGTIRAQLQGLYASMDQHAIPPGSPLALRLFS